jgi:hypothetical protein
MTEILIPQLSHAMPAGCPLCALCFLMLPRPALACYIVGCNDTCMSFREHLYQAVSEVPVLYAEYRAKRSDDGGAALASNHKRRPQEVRA